MIDHSRTGVAYKFKAWIDEVVFASAFGTKRQKIGVAAKLLDVDGESLRAFMSKCATNIKCLYLIDILVRDGNRRVLKYGYTNNIRRRFREHMAKFGSDIQLDTFIFIPEMALSGAEARFRQSVTCYIYEINGSTETELISVCDESYKNVKHILKSISETFCGNMQTQMNQYEHTIEQLKLFHQLEVMRLQTKIELAKKDNEILRLTALTHTKPKASANHDE